MDVKTLRYLVEDARKLNMGSVEMSVRTVEDLANDLERLQKELKEARKTLLDEFAMAALQGMLAFEGTTNFEGDATEAYGYAEAMLKARAKK